MSAEVYHHKRRERRNTVPAPLKHKGDNSLKPQNVGNGRSADQRLNAGSNSSTSSSVVPLPNISRDSHLKTYDVGIAARSRLPRTVPKRVSYRTGPAGKAENQQLAQTFGDLERICVKCLREAFSAKEHEYTEDIKLKDYLSHLLKLAGIYQESVKETENIYNVHRATGLLNLCLTMTEGEEDDIHGQITEQLLNFEYTVLKRVVKVKQPEVTGFFNERGKSFLQDDLAEMRDVFDADFNLLTECIRELPDEGDLLENEVLTTKQILAEDKIIAVASMMEAEMFERGRAILDFAFTQCLKLLGNLPCRFALLKLKDGANGFLTPYMSWSCFLLIEKDTAAVKAYFRNALTLFAMKIADIGETDLANLNIRSLDFLVRELEDTSGFSLCNHVESAAGGNKALIDCMRSSDDLIRSSTSSKIQERDKVYHVCDESRLIVGDQKLCKELPTIRQMVIQRQQTDVEYTERMLQSFEDLVVAINPIQNIDMTKENSSSYQSKICDTISTLQTIMFDLEKQLTGDDTKSRLEEITSSSYSPPSSFLCIITEKEENGLQSRFIGNLEGLVKPRLQQRWRNLDMDSASISDLNKAPLTVLQELKYIKTEMLPIESVDIRHQMMLSLEDEEQRALNKSVSTKDLYSPMTQLNVSLKKPRPKIASLKRPANYVAQPKNASNRVKGAEKAKVPAVESPAISPSVNPEVPEPLEVFDRMVGSVPSFSGRQKNLIGGNAAHSWLLLRYLADTMKHAEQKRPLIITDHRLPRVDYPALDQAYLKALQILLPIVESLRDISKSAGNLSTLKKMLYCNIDFSSNANELAAALVCFHDERYEDSCQAICKYLENRSDVTFIGEPFPADLIEVSQELLEERKITRDRYQFLLTLMANCQMKRSNFGEAQEYWKMLLVLTTDIENSADINRQLVNCYIALEDEVSAFEMATKALALYEELPKGRQRKERLEELKEIIDELEG